MTAPPTTTTRSFAPHVPKWQQFQLPLNNSCPYDRQYSHVYGERLTLLGPRVWKRIAAVNKDTTTRYQKVQRILELRENEPSTIVGTLVYEQEETFLEDESGRVVLQLKEQRYCTGAVVGVSGVVGKDGVMQVEDLYTPSLVEDVVAGSSPSAADGAMDVDTETISTGNSPLILILSGLECGNPHYSSMSRDMLLSYIQGVFGLETAARVAHVVVAGGLISKEASGTSGCHELDAWCWSLTQATRVPVTLLPGADDPTTANWPQRPLHRSLLPRSNNSLLNRTPNPMAAQLCDCTMIATDGTNAATIEQLRESLECGHICPQGPVQVPMVPNADPLVMATTPQLYVAGNCDAFATQTVRVDHGDEETKTCRLVCLPAFCSTGIAALVDPNTLAIELLRMEVAPEGE